MSSLNPVSALPGLFAGAAAPNGDTKETQKETGAARDFEALLIGQMLHSVREESSGWLGTGDDDDSSAAAFGFGEDQLAAALAKGGGLGLAKEIADGLAARSSQTDNVKAPSGS